MLRRDISRIENMSETPLIHFTRDRQHNRGFSCSEVLNTRYLIQVFLVRVIDMISRFANNGNDKLCRARSTAPR